MRILRKMADMAANAKFRIKLLVSYFLLVSFIILILGFAYYQISAKNMLLNVKESLGNVVINNNQLLDEKLQSIRDKSEMLPIDNELYRVITETDVTDNASLLKTDRKITQILFKYFGGDMDIYASFIVTPSYNFGNTARMFVMPDGFMASSLYRKSIEGKGNLVWIPTYRYAETLGEKDMSSLKFEFNKLASAVKQLKLTFVDEKGIFHSLPDTIPEPILMVNLTTDYIGRLFADYAQHSEYRHLSYGIVDDGGAVVIHSDEALIAKHNRPVWLEEAADRNNGSIQKVIDGKPVVISFSRMESTGWISYIEIPVEDALQDLNALRRYSTLFLIIMLIVSIILAYAMSVFITKPISRMKKAMKLMERGNFHIHIPEHGRDEFGHLIRTFNHMNGRIETLIEENYASRLREKEAELMALNLQLNPHFLYNTLTTLYWIAVENNQQEMSLIIHNLADMLQTSTRNKKETWPLRTDLDWLNKYIYIMSSRFENVFHVQIDVAAELLDMEVPKLFLQPFVENAIIHGLAEKEQDGAIVINGWSDSLMVYFTVEDNGCGMDKALIDQLKTGKMNSTGMPNVDKRIKLLYGSEYGVDIHPSEDGGTTVHIRMGLIASRRDMVEIK
ncbi:two-component system sensor histidine kinase YesM [Paenibacillus endophyticus]|uniref:Two-component system sensor histidine kinase YesM n=1 Tax=Paenibacillus endophyticus TaxID=1294268 RepID=A0A7W5GBY0_9BACL|nr:histidine kinase [Paenibacillus endophyticus]MBB3154779.1 two-component system sensor histidine kinase YesM [Paenibacillus endophyticus]